MKATANYDLGLIMKQLEAIERILETIRPGSPKQDINKPQSI